MAVERSFSLRGDLIDLIESKGPVTLIQWVKIAHSFLQSASDQFLIIILRLAYVILQTAVKEFFETHFQNGEIGRFNRSLFIESF